MAFKVQQINPLDLQPSVGVGVGLPFTSDQVFTTTYTTQDAIKANLINYFLTGKSERFFNPDLGAGLRAVLFDQMTEDGQDEIEYIVQTGLATWFPNVIVNQLTTQASPDSNTFTLFLRYSIANTNIQDELLINFEQ
jgi:phage baseplate assembly protein W